MSITSAIVLFAVLWFLTFLIVIPIRLKTQGDVGEIVEGTHAGAPADDHNLKRKALITTAIAAVLWLILFWIITQGIITVRDFDWMERLPPVGE